MTTHDRFLGCLLGLAVGDAVGTALEFKPRGSFTPITDMVGGGPFRLKPGQWTDDTSMACASPAAWSRRAGSTPRIRCVATFAGSEDGYLEQHRAVLRHRQRDWAPHWPASSGLATPSPARATRTAPATAPSCAWLPCRCSSRATWRRPSTTRRRARGRRTAPTECIDACRLFGGMLVRALQGAGKDEVLTADATTFSGAAKIADIARGSYRSKDERAIKGSAYVVASLEAALWCFDRTETLSMPLSSAPLTWATMPTPPRRCAVRWPGRSTACRASAPHGWRSWRCGPR